jgi:rhodanese-related sulfurtransferase
MNKWAGVLAAALAVHVTSAQAFGQTPDTSADFMFNGVRTSIAPASPDAVKYAALFAGVKPLCDPLCIVPETIADGIATLQQSDVVDFLVTAVATNTGLLADARMPKDRALGFIPGSVSLPHATLAQENEFRDDILKALGARAFEDLFNFTDARSLVVFDNGPTQNDAGVLIAYLLAAGYPPEKIRYYRGGMQVWSVLGLTVEE